MKGARCSIALALTALVALAVVATPAIATDDPMARAKRLFDRAEALVTAAKPAQALGLYEKAYELAKLPGFLFNIAQCHRLLRHHRLALTYYRRFLAQGKPSAALRAEVEKMMARERSALGDKAAPTSAPARGRIPRRVQRRRRVRPIRPAKIRAAAAKPHGSQPTSRRRPILLWSGVGLTAALLVVGVTTGQLASDKSEEFRDPRTSVDRRRSLDSTGRALSVTSVVTLVAAAAVGVSTALYYVLGGRREQPVAAAISPGGVFVALRRRF